MRNLPKFLLLALAPSLCFADGKLSLSTGYFAIDASASGKSSSISNPSAFHGAYQRAFAEQWEWKVGYSILMADFSGSDMGYGVDVGVNYYPFTGAQDEVYQDALTRVVRHETWMPYVGAGFHQRNFQSVRNSYAGLGVSAGAERYYSEKMNFKGELRYVTMGGSGDSEATETALFVGVVFKL